MLRQSLTTRDLAREAQAYYCTNNITNPQDELKASPITLHTVNGIPFEALFFDRNSDSALVIGQGFPGTKESMLSFVRLFLNYDIIIFDYRWNDIISFLLKPSTLLHPLNKLVYEEQEEVVAVVNFLDNHKQYEAKVCLGQCYSNFLFVAAQVTAHNEGKKLFDKLILDSCWHSFNAFAESISLDPFLPLSPQSGGAPEVIKSFLKRPIVRSNLLKLLKFVVPSVSIEEYLPFLHDSPILFIHGKNDLMVPLRHLELIWNLASNTPKAALITPYTHSHNKVDPTIYLFACDAFIHAPTIANFAETITQSKIMGVIHY